MKDYRVKVLVEFTIDVGADDKKIFDSVDTARFITLQVFRESFSRAHLLDVTCTELLDLSEEYR